MATLVRGEHMRSMNKSACRLAWASNIKSLAAQAAMRKNMVLPAMGFSISNRLAASKSYLSKTLDGPESKEGYRRDGSAVWLKALARLA